MPVDKIKKRNGNIVDFDQVRIERAMEKACIELGYRPSQGQLRAITDDIIAAVELQFGEITPGVEAVQDIVERKLAEHGLFDVAKAYILYRNDRELKRQEEKQVILQKIESKQITVKKRDGSVTNFDTAKIELELKKVAEDFSTPIDFEGILRDCKSAVYDGITTKDISKAIIMALRSRIERDPVYSSMASCFLFNDLYNDVLGTNEFSEDFKTVYQQKFAEKIQIGVASGRLDKRMLDFDLHSLSLVLKPERDHLFTYLGAQTLYDRYFIRNLSQEILEVPQYFWMRVAMGLSLLEENKELKAKTFYETISSLHYVPSTPTLFHSGTTHPQMSSCYLTTVDDDLNHIFKAIGDNAQLAKWSGGLGNDWTNIRGTGAQIKSTNVGSQGVVPFLKIVDAATAAINRSGKRRGATCVYLETWHYDIEDFLELRKNTGDERRRTHDTNTANWIPDLFMKRVLNNEGWTLFSPDEVPDLHHIYGKKFEQKYVEYEQKVERGEINLFKKVRAVDLWRKMITMMFETGHPWITFKDPCNVRSPQDHVGVVHSSNLCTEITLNTSREETAVCNLGSINLSRHITDGKLDRDQLKATVTTAIQMLDNVIDLNFYPTEESRYSNMRHRPIGMGVMGLQDALYKMDLQFDSEEAVLFSDEALEFISYYAILGSSQLAKERGAYSSYQGSKWSKNIFPIDTLKMLEEERGMTTTVDSTSRLDWSYVREQVRQFGMRNSNCMAIAPTATISNIAGCLPTVEPIYKNLYVKSNVSGEFTVVNQYLIEDLKKLGLWSKDILEKLKYYDGSIQNIKEIPDTVRGKYKEAFEIDTYWVIRHGAYRGKWIDQSQSINIFSSTQSGKAISEIYINAWKMGLKTTYYLRTLGASSIEKSTLDINKKYDAVTPSSTGAVEDLVSASVKACSIEDPTCEACQ
ncbi:MAG: ribonucleoside-diphosphate reductase subunit alpha [bacterium]